MANKFAGRGSVCSRGRICCFWGPSRCREAEGRVDGAGERRGGFGFDGDPEHGVAAWGVVAHFEVEGVVEVALGVLG